MIMKYIHLPHVCNSVHIKQLNSCDLILCSLSINLFYPRAWSIVRCREDFWQRCENHVERTKSRRCNVHTCGRGDGHMCTLACCKWERNENRKIAQTLVDVKIRLVHTRGWK